MLPTTSGIEEAKENNGKEKRHGEQCLTEALLEEHSQLKASP
jgi:hypothetical protein